MGRGVPPFGNLWGKDNASLQMAVNMQERGRSPPPASSPVTEILTIVRTSSPPVENKSVEGKNEKHHHGGAVVFGWRCLVGVPGALAA